MSRTSQTRRGRNIPTVRLSSSGTSLPCVGSDHVKSPVVLIARKAVGRQIDQSEHVSNQPGNATLVVGVSHAKSSAPQRRTRHFRLPSRLRSWAGRSPHLVFLQDEHNLGRRRGRNRQGVCFNRKIPQALRAFPREPTFLLTSPWAELSGMFIETLRLETPNGSENSQTQRKDRRKRRAHLLGYMRRMLRSHQRLRRHHLHHRSPQHVPKCRHGCLPTTAARPERRRFRH